MAAIHTPGHLKLRWRPPNGTYHRADGAEYKEATGHKGTYEWITKDGFHSAYHYPNGSKTPKVLLHPRPVGNALIGRASNTTSRALFSPKVDL